VQRHSFQGQFWTVQCEVIEEEIMGALSADEEPPPPPNDNGLPPAFDFFRFGQLGPGPFIPHNENQEESAKSRSLGTMGTIESRCCSYCSR
jgi:hypothetical protein